MRKWRQWYQFEWSIHRSFLIFSALFPSFEFKELKCAANPKPLIINAFKTAIWDSFQTFRWPILHASSFQKLQKKKKKRKRNKKKEKQKTTHIEGWYLSSANEYFVQTDQADII